jgi:hypothetical protein
VFLSASYATGAIALEAGPGQWKKLWSSDDVLSNHYATSVVHNGYLYGYHGRQEEGPNLRCVELRTGKVQWDIDHFGSGTVTLAGDQLLIVRESGEFLTAPASPRAFQPANKATLLPATIRAYPAFAGGRIFVRNEKTLAAYSLLPILTAMSPWPDARSIALNTDNGR